jgi:hypothetical protein
MKNEFFSGVFSKSLLNILVGLGISISTILIFELPKNIGEWSKIYNIGEGVVIPMWFPLKWIVTSNPLLFCNSFIIGFLISNLLIKEMQIITFKKKLYLLSFIILWILSVLLFAGNFWL